MASRHLSLRIDPETFDRLEAESRRVRRSVSEVARNLLDEGLRLEAHPGIVFRDGPAGRRAGLSDGPDVWEVIESLGPVDKLSPRVVKIVLKNTSLNQRQIETALRYYARFPLEIDAFVQRNQAESEQGEAEAEWLRRIQPRAD